MEKDDKRRKTEIRRSRIRGGEGKSEQKNGIRRRWIRGREG